MKTIKIKALSTNAAYRGRRFSTPELKKYKEELAYLLPKMRVPKGRLAVKYIFGLSSKGSDWDNCTKAWQDSLSETYGFNDNLIYRAEVEKRDVKKGEEFVAFEITKYIT